jgi:hypothetical protein
MSKDQFPLSREFKNSFIYVAPGLTYTIPIAEGELLFNVIDTNINHYTRPQEGVISYAFEIGWYHTFERPRFFHYLDAGIAYRKFIGNSEFELEKTWDGGQLSQTADGRYDVAQITGVFRLIRSQQLGKFTFLTFGPGINFDYQLSDNSSNSPFLENYLDDANRGHLHLQVGLGLRLTEKLIFQPQIELPILEFYTLGDLVPEHEFYNSKHYPILLSFRFMFLRKDLMNCNAPTLN